MSRQSSDLVGNTPRLLASAVGVAITAMSGSHLAHAAESSEKKPSQDVLSLDADTVVGTQQDPTTYNVEKSASKKYTAPLLDTPRSVTVVPQQVIKDTGALTLQDALRTVPGITFGAGEGGNPTGDRPFIRGFDAQSDTYVDGVRDTGAQSREVFNLEQIEVSKGPNSAFGGRGAAGGSLNLISKQAKAGNFTDGSFTYGSDQTRRYTLDTNQEFLDGNAAFRLNLMTHDQNVAGRQAVDASRWGIAPSLTFGLNGPTRVTVSHYHLESDDTPDSGIPYAKSADRSKHNPDKPVNVDRDNFYGLEDRDFSKSRVDTSTITFEHDFNDNLSLRNTTRYGTSHQDYIMTQPDDSQGNVNNGTVWRRNNNRISTTTTATNQTDLFGEFYLAGFKNSFTTGLEFSREDSKRDGYTVDTNTGLNTNKCRPSIVGAPSGYNCTSLENPNPHDPWNGSITRNYKPLNTVGTTKAIYGFDTIDLNEQWQINAGVRFDSFETTAKNHGASPATKFEDSSNFWNWQAGVVYKPAPNGSIYASYATSATPPGAMLDNGNTSNAVDAFSVKNNLEPEETTNYEIGTKWSFLDERLELTGAIFRTDKDNARILVASQTYDNAGQSRVDGLELTASGKLTDKWKVFAGYSYLDSELVKAGKTGRNGNITANVPSNDGNEMPNTPKNSFSLWTTYDVLPNATIGGGTFYVDKVYGDVANTMYVPDYWRYDAMAAYKLSKNVDFQLNVQNVFDKKYFDKAYASHYATQAAGRTVLLSTNFHF
ncbi:TonB-dependent siderophore receptor [Pseudomonas sp. PSE14]|uniref:TonB-dependent receptor n=1 Tax=Pseudomonas sp. PSE14 TaxID=3016341 RepID=UPI0023D814C7|nr:TonB-dependent siderophore receptor [Pseudomonas sp. PSE14]WEJ73245.1 TonB-dependent siderophore receptor [Pseudomonas sp. PSE14]